MQTASFASVAQLVEQWTENPRVAGSTPAGGTNFADVAHLVERYLAKVEVASSSLVIRSIFLVSFLYTVHNLIVRCHSQVVRQRSAKPRFPSSNLGGTSRVKAPKSLCIKAFGVFLLPERNFALVEQNSILASKLPNFCRIWGRFTNFAEPVLSFYLRPLFFHSLYTIFMHTSSFFSLLSLLLTHFLFFTVSHFWWVRKFWRTFVRRLSEFWYVRCQVIRIQS